MGCYYCIAQQEDMRMYFSEFLWNITASRSETRYCVSTTLWRRLLMGWRQIPCTFYTPHATKPKFNYKCLCAITDKMAAHKSNLWLPTSNNNIFYCSAWN